ncbi:unnamed protein product [Tuber aestivum]|uniref:F-box domain-containing protein n=1 Tax=Tuber aestivum TaxID=59557 RepID=A0A292Q451_9PEZI|nr:unnamed protein product [Tuber aestivum]
MSITNEGASVMSPTVPLAATIASLPVEIHTQILQSLPCFHDVHSAILTSRLFHNAWITGQNGIINAVARETIRPWEPLVRLYLARRQQRFEASPDNHSPLPDEVTHYRLTLHAIIYICARIKTAETKYKAMLSKPPLRRNPYIGEGPELPPRTPCALELDLFTTTYLTMKLIEAYPPNLLASLLSSIATMDLLRIRQLQNNIYTRDPRNGGGDRGRLVQREFMTRLPRGSGVWEAMAERMMGGEPFALWGEGQEQVRGFEQAMKEGRLPWDTGAGGAVEVVWGAGGVEGFTGVQRAGGRGGIMGFYRYV